MPARLNWIAMFCLSAVMALGLIAKADTLVFEGHTGNTYHYDLTLDYVNSGFTLDNVVLYQPEFVSLRLSGLSGVTGVSVSGALATNGDLALKCTFTSSEVDCKKTGTQLISTSATSITIGDLSVFSLADPGTAGYSVVDVGPDSPGSSGTVLAPIPSAGPISATPEPSTLLLLGTGVTTFIGVSRRRFFKQQAHRKPHG